MFLLNSRYPLLYYAKKHSFFLSYRVNLPSSLTFFIPFAFICSTSLHAFECGTVCYRFFPDNHNLLNQQQLVNFKFKKIQKDVDNFYRYYPSYISAFAL